ncbi:hypothetical protein SKC41_26775 [Mycobacterium sp. 050128]|uniref:hypothetical protein n=1 Tax=Mycobacterium sp. 050128 TaxID=3096112 RepID=UPI002EDB697A
MNARTKKILASFAAALVAVTLPTGCASTVAGGTIGGGAAGGGATAGGAGGGGVIPATLP